MAGIKDSYVYDGNCPCNTPPMAVHKMSSHLLVITISVNLAIQIMVRHIHCIQMILSGKEKDMVIMKQTVAQLLVFHGFIKPLTLPLTTLN